MKISQRNGKTILNKKKRPAKSALHHAKKLFSKRKKKGFAFISEDHPDSIAEAMESFPLKDKIVPEYASRKDKKNILEFRISYADVYNTDSYLYLMIAQALHVYEKFSIGIPGNWGENMLPMVTEEITFHDGSLRTVEKDPNFELRVEMYSAHVKSLRDEFIWLHEVDTILDNVSPEEHSRRVKEAFADLSELAPGLWI